MGSSTIVFQGLSDPAMLEDLAFREALTLAADLHVDRVIVAIVCLQVINDIDSATGGSYALIIREIDIHHKKFHTVYFFYEGRKSNTKAHNLAHHSLTLGPGRNLWLLEPPQRKLNSNFCGLWLVHQVSYSKKP
jgi:hypothetical protein